MSQFASRQTPMTAPWGTQVAAVGSGTQLLSSLCTIPPEANSATVIGAGAGLFGFRLDGAEGQSDAMQATSIELGNRRAIDLFAVCFVDAAEVVVQFYTGRSGL